MRRQQHNSRRAVIEPHARSDRQHPRVSGRRPHASTRVHKRSLPRCSPKVPSRTLCISTPVPQSWKSPVTRTDPAPACAHLTRTRTMCLWADAVGTTVFTPPAVSVLGVSGTSSRSAAPLRALPSADAAMTVQIRLKPPKQCRVYSTPTNSYVQPTSLSRCGCLCSCRPWPGRPVMMCD